MSNWSRRARKITLGLVVLAAVGHANLAADLTGRTPNTFGMTRLGRDLLRNQVLSSAAAPTTFTVFLQISEAIRQQFYTPPL